MRKDHEKWEWFNYLCKKLYEKPKNPVYSAPLKPSAPPAKPLIKENVPAPPKTKKTLAIPIKIERKLGYWH
jgi:hypothetical protein